MKIAATVLALTLALPTIGSSEIVQIEFTKFDTFSIEVVHIDVGDKVDWLPKNAGHNVEFIAGPKMNALPKNSKMDRISFCYFQNHWSLFVWLHSTPKHGDVRTSCSG